MFIFMLLATGLSFLVTALVWREVNNKMRLNLKFLGEHNQKDLELPRLGLIKLVYLLLILFLNFTFWLLYLLYF